MKTRIALWILIVCGGCILLKSCVPGKPKEQEKVEPPPGKKEERPSITILNRALLTPLRIYATTTAYREHTKPLLPTTWLGLTHKGSADIVLDLTEAEVEHIGMGKEERIRVTLPLPRLDERSIGINPRNITIKTSSTPPSRAEDFAKLRESLLNDVVEKLKATFADFDMHTAKAQALLVLSNLYAQAGYDNVEIIWKDEKNASSSTPTNHDFAPQGGAL